MKALDLFAGPGGWDEGIAELGIRPLGIEWDAAACATRDARGHRTLQADVATLDPLEFAPCDLLIGSPPCQAFSTAGKGDGHLDVPLILLAAEALMLGDDVRADFVPKLADRRSLLVVEPLRWALALKPTFIALEQVPPALRLWRVFADHLRARDYHVWTGILNSADYGVPQTRERAILMASRVGPVRPPRATHCKGGAHTLEGELLPWVSMADALGWTGSEVVNTRGDRQTPGGNEFPSDRPSWALTEKARSWVLRNGNQANAAERTPDENGNRQPVRLIPDTEPAPTLDTNVQGWVFTQPAPTTVTTDPRIGEPGHRDRDGGEPQYRPDAIRVTLQEAATLQGFPADYPWQGSRTKQFEQVGNAVPPPLARHIIGALVGAQAERRAA